MIMSTVNKDTLSRFVIPPYQKAIKPQPFSQYPLGHRRGKRIVWELVRNEKFESVLDVGCGLGFDMEQFSRMGLKCVGVDPIPENVRRARQRCPKAKVQLGFAHKLPFPARSFDLVYSWGVVEILPRVEDMVRAIKEFVRVARRSVLIVDCKYPPVHMVKRRLAFPIEYHTEISSLSRDARYTFTIWRCDKLDGFVGRRALGRHTLFGVPFFHNYDAIHLFEIVFKNYRPARVIELGTGPGGSGCLLKLLCMNHGATFYTYDKRVRLADTAVEKLVELRQNFRNKDFLEPSTISEIGKLIGARGRTFLYVDDSAGRAIFNTYGKFLKTGDVLGCHDWRSDIRPKDVEDAERRYNLTPILRDSLRRYWTRQNFWIRTGS